MVAPPMPELTKSFTMRDMFCEIARSQVHVTENPPNSNRGLKVEEYLKTTGLVYTKSDQSYAWCAAFVTYVGLFVADMYSTDWPLIRSAGVDTRFSPQWTGFFQDATQKHVLRDTPTEGAIFLLWSNRKKRFAHTGICYASAVRGWRTIEGNTNGGGSREGWGVFDRTRVFTDKDKFIYWWLV